MSKDLVKSLNQGHSEFYLEDLEQRLETDPLSIGALLDIDSANGEDACSSYCWGYEYCKPKEGCDVISCTWH